MNVLYSNGCPKCKALEIELKQNNIQYQKVDDMEKIMNVARENKLSTVPLLDNGIDILTYEQAISWIKGGK